MPADRGKRAFLHGRWGGVWLDGVIFGSEIALRNSAVPLNQTCGGGIERPLHQEKGRVANICKEGRAEPSLTEASSCGLLPSAGWVSFQNWFSSFTFFSLPPFLGPGVL